MIAGKPKYKEKLIDKTLNESEEQFIFYNNQKEVKFQQQIEIQAILNSNNSHKVMVIIDRKSTFDYLSVKIAEEMEKFVEYANLDGLKAVNLMKRTDKGLVKVPSSGEIKDFVTGGDVIFCDLSTSEVWIKTSIKVFANCCKTNISLDLKFNIELIFEKLKMLLMKLGINLWMDYAKKPPEEFHYAFVNAKFKTIKSKNSFEYNISDFNKSSHFESMKIKEIFDFSSEISCTVNLVSLEEILFNELKKINLDSDSVNCLRLNEYKEFSFDGFLSEKKFQPEKNFIMKYISKLIKSTFRNTHPSFYIYNKNYTGKEDDDMKTINQNEAANLIIVPNSFMEENTNNNSRKISVEDPLNHNKKESPEIPDDADEEEQEIPNLSLGNQEVDFKSRMGRSFLEKSKIINDFQKNNADSNDKEHKDFASCSSLEKTVLFVKSNQDEEDRFNAYNTEDFKKSVGIKKKVQSANFFAENNDTKFASEPQQDMQEELKKSGPHPTHKKFSSIFTRIRSSSKYSNLTTEFRTYLKAKCLLEVIESYSNIKMCKNALEHVGIPHSRDLNIISEDINAITRIQSILPNKEDEPISVNNKKILTFISVLSIIFIGAILFIFLSN